MLEKLFMLKAHDSSIKKELYAGFIIFCTMSYIIFVNPMILGIAGMNVQLVFIATCLIITISCILMAFYANLPLAVAPGMGLNAIFSYTIVIQMGYAWQHALAVTFVAGLIILLASIFFSSSILLRIIPSSLSHAITAGIGAFIILIGLNNADIIVAHPATLVTLGNVSTIKSLTVLIGFVFITLCFIKRFYYAPIIVIFIASVISYLFGLDSNQSSSEYASLSLTGLFFNLQFPDIFNLSIITVIISLSIAAFFDSYGTFTSYSYFVNPKEGLNKKNLKKAIQVEGIGCALAGLLGTSPTAIYLESNAGVSFGGRTGLTALTVGILFLVAILALPLLDLIPMWSSSPILMFIGFLMVTSIKNLNWNDYSEVIPGVLCLFMMPLTYSISTGIAFAVISFCLIKLLLGKRKEVPLATWVLGIIFIAYLYMI